MRPYADPSRCPDCRSPLPADPVACPVCHLPLSGPQAAALTRDLFQTLQHADALVARLRVLALPVGLRPAEPAATPDAAVPPADPVDPWQPYPTSRPPQPAPARTGVRGATVPRILLGLGALCLLAFGLIFMAVTWSLLPVELRVLVLLGLTSVAGFIAWYLSGRRLSAAAESLTVVCLGLVPVVVGGARAAGWMPFSSDEGFVVVSSVLVAATGLGLAVGSLAAHGRAILTGQVAAVGGLALGGLVASSWTGWPATSLTTTVLLLAALGWWVRTRAGLPVLRAGAAVTSPLVWLVLAVLSLGRVLDREVYSWSGLLTPATVGATLAAAILLPCLPLAHGLAVRWRTLVVPWLVGISVVLVGVLPASTLLDRGTDPLALLGLGVVAAATAASLPLPRHWLPAPAVPAAIGLLVVVPGALAVAATGLAALAPRAVPFTRPADLVVDPLESGWSTWVLPATVVVVSLLAIVAARHAGRAQRLVLGVVVLTGLATVPAVVGHVPVPLALLLATLVPFTALASWWGRHQVGAAVAAGIAVVVLVVGSLPSEVLSLVVVATLTAVLLGWLLRGGTALLLPVSALPVAAGATAILASMVLDAPRIWWALPVLAVTALLLVWLRRRAVEPGALLAVVVATTLAVEAHAHPLSWLALHLTLAGAVVGVRALLTDRGELRWAASLLVLVATWLRLADTGVETVEAYTLPASLVLAAVGLRAMARDPQLGSARALGLALTGATVPSLLAVFGGGLGLRAALLGIACLLLVLGGTRLRWSAPLVVGAVVGAALVLRIAGPYAALLPPWMLVGLAGALLTVVGITWEAQIQRVQRTQHQIARLR